MKTIPNSYALRPTALAARIYCLYHNRIEFHPTHGPIFYQSPRLPT